MMRYLKYYDSCIFVRKLCTGKNSNYFIWKVLLTLIAYILSVNCEWSYYDLQIFQSITNLQTRYELDCT